MAEKQYCDLVCVHLGGQSICCNFCSHVDWCKDACNEYNIDCDDLSSCQREEDNYADIEFDPFAE